MRPRLGLLVLALGLLAGCAGGDSGEPGQGVGAAPTTAAPTDPFGPAPATPSGPLDAGVVRELDLVFSTLDGDVHPASLHTIGSSGDARLAWVVSDLMRFFQTGGVAEDLLRAFERLTGTTLEAEDRAPGRAWKAVTDRLIEWNLPAPPGYVRYKERLFTLVEPRWAPFFRDRESEIDWRRVSWGGVYIDNRPLGDPSPCPLGCIPALDDPAVTGASGGSWYPPEAIVFGVIVDGRARAYPKNVMEVHEMVNDTLGHRRIGMPYCTLCGSAQAYFTDRLGRRPLVLRTSGLLSRSNKVMYELHSKSVFDTFTGRALSGPLRRAGVVLQPITVVTSTWAAWRAAHPETTIVARDGGIGRDYPADPLRGRDDDGPIFPIGAVDPRLPTQERVVGVIAPDGTPLAFPAAAARAALEAGEPVELAGARLQLDGDGLRAVAENGVASVSHEAFWFAWSQFHPGTAVWIRRVG